MGVISNLITGQTSSLLTSVGDWFLADASPHALAVSQEQVRFTGMGSLRLTAGSSAAIDGEMDPVSIGDFHGYESRGFVWVYASNPVVVTLGITVYKPSTVSASSTTSVPAGRWTLASVTGTTTSEGDTLKLGFSITGLSATDTVYLTNPVLLSPDAVGLNVFAAETWLRLPEFMRDADITQESPTYPLLRFLDVTTTVANDVFMLWDTYRYIPPEDGGNDEAESLLAPASASLEVLRWWAQILGITFYDPSTGTTPWINFKNSFDETWLGWITGLDISPTDGTVTWSEVQEFSPESTGLLDLLRWEVETAYFGIRAGTREAIVECVKKVLSDTQTTTFLTAIGGDPWKFKVQTLQSETPDSPALGDPSATVEEIVAGAIPAGFQFVHETVAG